MYSFWWTSYLTKTHLSAHGQIYDNEFLEDKHKLYIQKFVVVGYEMVRQGDKYLVFVEVFCSLMVLWLVNWSNN